MRMGRAGGKVSACKLLIYLYLMRFPPRPTDSASVQDQMYGYHEDRF